MQEAKSFGSRYAHLRLIMPHVYVHCAYKTLRYVGMTDTSYPLPRSQSLARTSWARSNLEGVNAIVKGRVDRSENRAVPCS